MSNDEDNFVEIDLSKVNWDKLSLDEWSSLEQKIADQLNKKSTLTDDKKSNKPKLESNPFNKLMTGKTRTVLVNNAHYNVHEKLINKMWDSPATEKPNFISFIEKNYQTIIEI